MIRKLGTRWDVCNTPLHIRIKNWIPFYPLNYPPGTCGGVFNRYIPKRDTYLLDTYLSNPILSKDGMARKPLIQKQGTRRGVFNTPLPIRIKNLIPIYWMNLKPGGFWGVCLCDQPHPGEELLKFVWIHAKPGGDWMKMAIFTENPPRIG